MKLTILGATGATGISLTSQALAAGHEVTAVVRDPDPPDRAGLIPGCGPSPPTSWTPHPSPRPSRARTPSSLTVGPRGTGPTTVIQDSVHSIIRAMDKTGTRRFLQISGSIVADEGESAYMRYVIKPVARRTFLRHVCADMRHGEDEIRDSDLDWTIFRPPGLNGKPATGAYRTAIDRNLAHGFTVSRADLAACMLAMLADPATVHRHVAIAS